MAETILVSACLLGLTTRYDGKAAANEKVLAYLRRNQAIAIPVCPEQLAGLPTPRPRCWFANGDGATLLSGTGRLENENGEDVSSFFLDGARQCLTIAQLVRANRAILKERSPSCGSHQVYLGQEKVDGQGVTAALLKQHNVVICSDEDFDEENF
ncbi:DUF523 domain-containing protein [Pelobacter seleniigenes]|uniref:DUF523 domain-containing protein n=1 Tax=Pelobacter seleniigenes TaxID=407188 RepID=UPI0004A73759|nr:DUF523 domain-containing protein [Pelobacter seleniigenes]